MGAKAKGLSEVLDCDDLVLHRVIFLDKLYYHRLQTPFFSNFDGLVRRTCSTRSSFNFCFSLQTGKQKNLFQVRAYQWRRARRAQYLCNHRMADFHCLAGSVRSFTRKLSSPFLPLFNQHKAKNPAKAAKLRWRSVIVPQASAAIVPVTPVSYFILPMMSSAQAELSSECIEKATCHFFRLTFEQWWGFIYWHLPKSIFRVSVINF